MWVRHTNFRTGWTVRRPLSLLNMSLSRRFTYFFHQWSWFFQTNCSKRYANVKCLCGQIRFTFQSWILLSKFEVHYSYMEVRPYNDNSCRNSDDPKRFTTIQYEELHSFGMGCPTSSYEWGKQLSTYFWPCSAHHDLLHNILEILYIALITLYQANSW